MSKRLLVCLGLIVSLAFVCEHYSSTKPATSPTLLQSTTSKGKNKPLAAGVAAHPKGGADATPANSLPETARPATGIPDLAPIQAYGQWQKTWLSTPPDQRAPLVEEGVRLATDRREEFHKLIKADPQRALEESVSHVARQSLPAEVIAQLEEHVNTYGDYNVYQGRPQEGVVLPADTELTLRYFETETSSYRAHVYGSQLPTLSRKNIALRGVAIERDLAVAESPVRRLDAGEIIPAGTPVDSTCPVSGTITTLASAPEEPIAEETPAVEVGGRYILLCNGSHVRVLDDSYRQASGGPGGAQFIKENVPGTSSEAIGNFRALYIRVLYPDDPVAPNSEATANDDMRNMSRYFLENSFGKLSTTYAVTPLVMLPHTKAWYVAKDTAVDGLGLVHSDARSAARRLGYDSGSYNVTIVRVKGGPRLEGVSWGGGDSVWVSWNGMDVLNHECGHSLGRNHANYWNTNGLSALSDGANQEYGNSFDVMGGGSGFGAHYNTMSKRALGWLPDTWIHQARSGTATYRIYPYDQPILVEGRRYAIRIPRADGYPFHLEYHNAYSQHSNSALLLWGRTDISNAGHLVDTTPGSSGGKNDAGIAVGQTFSDWDGGVHITVLGKNNTTPPSLDIVVNRDTPSNRPPALSLSASGTTVAVGGSLTFTATASDPDGDTLAYHWDFPDGYASTNTPSITRSFPTADHMTVHCTVSDLKGGIARRHAVFEIGANTRRVVSGRVTSAGLPVVGVLLAGDGEYAYTDSDGYYAMSDISDGSHDITATLQGYTFTPAGFANPLTVASGTNSANFTADALPVVQITAGGNATEGGANGSFVITRTGDTTAALTVRVLTASGTAIRATDYNFNPTYTSSGLYRTFDIPAGASSLTVNVEPVNDTAAEGPETIGLNLADSTAYLAGSNRAAQIILNDNDSLLPNVSVSLTNDQVDEKGGSMSFVLSRTGDTANSLNVTAAWSGTATRGTDYPSLPTAFTIPAGQASLSITFAPTDDALSESTETATLTVTSTASYLADPSSKTATVSILDDEIPVVTVVASDPNASEANRDPGVFLITRTGPTTSALKVYYGLGGRALHGTDYLALPLEVTIPAGQTSAPVVITPVDDGFGEIAESVNLNLSTYSTAYQIGEPSTATVTIADNLDPPTITVSPNAVATEPGTAGSFKLQLAGSVAGNVTVNYTLSGTAASGTDFTAPSGSVSIAGSGANEGTVTITPLDDSIPEDAETVTLTVTPSANYVSFQNSATIYLRDKRAQVYVSTHKDTPAEPATGSSFYLSRTSSTTADLVVNYTMGGTATNGTDYTLLPGTVTIPAGATGVDIPVTVIDDTLVEGIETIILNVSPSADYSVNIPSAKLYLNDNDTVTATASVGFQATASTVSEAPDAVTGEFRTIPVTLSAALTTTVTAEYIVSTGTAATTAIADGVDYNLADAANGNALITEGLLTFPPGNTLQYITIRVINDGVKEGDEIAGLEIRNVYGARVSTSRNKHTLTITDNTALNPVPRVFFLSATAQAEEDDTVPQGLMAALDQPATASVTVNYTVSGGTATAGSDYSGTTGTLTFAAGETVKLIPVTVKSDAVVELPETFNVTLSSPSANAALGGTATQTVTILEAFTPSVSLTAPQATASEPSTTGTFTVTRASGGNVIPLTISYSVTGTATSGTDYTALAGTVSLPAGQNSATITMTPLDDSAIEPDETVTITLTPDVSYSVQGSDTATISLQDNDILPVITLVSPTETTAAIPAGVGLFLQTTTELPGRTTLPTLAWSKVAGPGSVTFGTPSAAETSAQFSANGNYRLRLTAAGGAATATLDVVVNVGLPATAAANIGVNTVTGTASFAADAWTVTGSGSGISGSGTSDGFVLVGQPRSGDFDIVARIASRTYAGTGSSCRIGLMARASNATDAPYAATFYKTTSGGNGPHNFQYRATAATAPTESVGTTLYAMPRWLRLVRSGDNVSAFLSPDGITWTQRGTTVSLPNLGASPIVGLALTTADQTKPATAVFDSLNFKLPVNLGPLVDAGAAVNGSGPQALNATVSDDGLPIPASLTSSWSVVNGPGPGSFGDAAAVDTAFTSTSAGTFTLRLSASDGAITTFDDVTATIITTPFDSWRVTNFGSSVNLPEIGGDLADPDHDGIPNLLEYAFNLTPNSPDSGPKGSTAANQMSLVYRRNLSAGDITFGYEQSTDLTTWTAVTPTTTVLSNDGQTQTIQATVPMSGNQRFLRLTVTRLQP